VPLTTDGRSSLLLLPHEGSLVCMSRAVATAALTTDRSAAMSTKAMTVMVEEPEAFKAVAAIEAATPVVVSMLVAEAVA
jgi:hypothetical protein